MTLPFQRICTHCNTNPLGKFRSKCDDCRKVGDELRRQRWRRRVAHESLSVPVWVDGARVDYEDGLAVFEIAPRYGVGTSSVSIYARILRWDRAAHRRARRVRLYPWASRIRPLYESGTPMELLIADAGVSETTLVEAARIFEWDGAARWDAIWSHRREGMTRTERDRTRAKAHKLARRAQSDRTVTSETIAFLQADLACPYCNCTLTPENRSIDHIGPISRGGAESADNLTAACITCNISKHDRPLLLWLVHRAHRRAA